MNHVALPGGLAAEQSNNSFGNFVFSRRSRMEEGATQSVWSQDKSKNCTAVGTTSLSNIYWSGTIKYLEDCFCLMYLEANVRYGSNTRPRGQHGSTSRYQVKERGRKEEG